MHTETGSEDRRSTNLLWSQLLDYYLDYYFVGGIPEAVARGFASGDELLRRIREIWAIHRDLVTQFERDFGKYAEGFTHNTSQRCLRTCHASWPTAKTAQCAVFVSRV